jgi:hypothetical protein
VNFFFLPQIYAAPPESLFIIVILGRRSLPPKEPCISRELHRSFASLRMTSLGDGPEFTTEAQSHGEETQIED